MKLYEPNHYFVFIKEGYDRKYFCVAGREINHADAVCFLFEKEASKHCLTLNQKLNHDLNK